MEPRGRQRERARWRNPPQTTNAYDVESLLALSGWVGFAEWGEVMHGSAENRLD
ncbi:hypothetical protein OKW42_004220 [Paraburkholderia sp. WC7.3d]